MAFVLASWNMLCFERCFEGGRDGAACSPICHSNVLHKKYFPWCSHIQRTKGAVCVIARYLLFSKCNVKRSRPRWPLMCAHHELNYMLWFPMYIFEIHAYWMFVCVCMCECACACVLVQAQVVLVSTHTRIHTNRESKRWASWEEQIPSFMWEKCIAPTICWLVLKQMEQMMLNVCTHA